MSTGVVLLAAGTGLRFHQRKPKQFFSLAGEPLFVHPLKVFSKISSVKEIVVVVSHQKRRSFESKLKRIKLNNSIGVVSGGKTRGHSVRAGVIALSKKVKTILIHDAARPLVSPDIIKRVEKAAQIYGVALAAWPLADTLKKGSKKGRVLKTIPRKNLWLAQTPQGFKASVARRCLLSPSQSATDDVELAERKGYKVKLVLGGPHNMKVTYPYDLLICRALI